MEQLKQFIHGCRQHYEKILLSLVLLGLAGAIWILYSKAKDEDQKLKQSVGQVVSQKGREVPQLDLSRNTAVLQLAENPPALSFSAPHNLLNPVKWQQRADGTRIKIETGREVGIDQLLITNVEPLYFVVSLDRIPAPGSYFIGVEDQAAPRDYYGRPRPKQQKFATLNAKNEIFTLKEIKGPPEDPTELVLELEKNQERISISKDNPYRRLDGFEADMVYPVDNTVHSDKRAGDKIRVAGENYNIVAINTNEVVLSATANDRRYTIRRAAGR